MGTPHDSFISFSSSDMYSGISSAINWGISHDRFQTCATETNYVVLRSLKPFSHHAYNILVVYLFLLSTIKHWHIYTCTLYKFRLALSLSWPKPLPNLLYKWANIVTIIMISPKSLINVHRPFIFSFALRFPIILHVYPYWALFSAI